MFVTYVTSSVTVGNDPLHLVPYRRLCCRRKGLVSLSLPNILCCKYLSGRLLHLAYFSRSCTAGSLIESQVVSVNICRGQRRPYNTHFTSQTDFSLHGQNSAARSRWPTAMLKCLQQRTGRSNTSAWCSPHVSSKRSLNTALVAKATPAACSKHPTVKLAADTVLVVESKTKANKIQKFLGQSYKVTVMLDSAIHVTSQS